LVNEIKKNGIGWACNTYGGEEMYIQVWWRNLKDRNHFEDIDVDDRIL